MRDVRPNTSPPGREVVPKFGTVVGEDVNQDTPGEKPQGDPTDTVEDVDPDGDPAGTKDGDPTHVDGALDGDPADMPWPRAIENADDEWEAEGIYRHGVTAGDAVEVYWNQRDPADTIDVGAPEGDLRNVP
jgi:hypothetical protein